MRVSMGENTGVHRRGWMVAAQVLVLVVSTLGVIGTMGTSGTMNLEDRLELLENAFLRVEVESSTGSVSIVDKKAGVTWQMDPSRGDSGRVEVCDKQSLEWLTAPEQRWTSHKTLRFGVGGREGLMFGAVERGKGDGFDYVRFSAPVTDLPGTTLTLEYRLLADAPDIEFRMRVTGPQAVLVTSAAFPAGLSVEPNETGYLILPSSTGVIVPNGRYEFSESRRLYAGGGQQGYTMRFFGASKVGKSGTRSAYGALLDCSLQTLIEAASANGRVSVGAKIYGTDIALDGWKRDYYVRYHFISGGSYVDVAKWYRGWAQTRGMIRTFAEKVKEHPNLARLPGAFYVGGLMFYYNWEPYVAVKGEKQAKSQFLVSPPFKKVYHKFEDVLPYIARLKRAGARRAIFHLAGWNRFGYDGKYPDVFPANEESGGPQGFRQLCDAIKDAGYIALAHDDVMITFEDAPSYTEEILARQADGSPYYLGTWPGGNSFIVNTEHQLNFIRCNLPLIAEAYAPNGYYLDCETNVPPVHDFSTAHPTSMDEDLRLRGAVFDEVRRHVDVIGSETICDWAAPYLDYGGHAYDGYELRATDRRGKEIEGIVVPLWELVYHDVMYGVRSDDENAYGSKDAFVRQMRAFLRTLRAGTLPPSIRFGGEPKSLSHVRDRAKAAHCKGWASLTEEQILQTFSELSAAVGDLTFSLPMTDHSFLADDHMVEVTTFGENVRVAVNGRTDPFELSPDTILAPLGFLVESPRFVAMCATRYRGWSPAEPTLFWLESDDGLPLAEAKSIRLYWAFGNTRIPFESSRRTGRAETGTELVKDTAGKFVLEVSSGAATHSRYRLD